jgi:hypothetical protein
MILNNIRRFCFRLGKRLSSHKEVSASFLWLGAVTALLNGCVTPPKPGIQIAASIIIQPAFVRLPDGNQMVQISFDDGVSSFEAKVIAAYYFTLVYGGCGGIGAIEDHGNEWYFPCRVGYSGTRMPGIRVSKIGCNVECESGPTINKPDILSKPTDSVWSHQNVEQDRFLSRGIWFDHKDWLQGGMLELSADHRLGIYGKAIGSAGVIDPLDQSRTINSGIWLDEY